MTLHQHIYLMPSSPATQGGHYEVATTKHWKSQRSEPSHMEVEPSLQLQPHSGIAYPPTPGTPRATMISREKSRRHSSKKPIIFKSVRSP